MNRRGTGKGRVIVSDHVVEHGMLVLVLFQTLFCRKDFVNLFQGAHEQRGPVEG